MAEHKVEAIRALQSVIGQLGGAEPLDGLKRFQVKAAAEYALAEVAAIQELKRARRAAPILPGGQT